MASLPVRLVLFALAASLFLIFPWLHGLDVIWEQMLFAGCVMALFGLSCFFCEWNMTLDLARTGSLFSLWLIYSALYLIPLTPELMQPIAPRILYWYNLTPEAPAYYLSVYRQASLIEWFKFLTLPALFITLYWLTDCRRKLFILINIIVAGCSVTAIYSQLNFLTGGAYEIVDNIPPWDLSWENGIRGTFSYKNQYALYIAIALALATGLLIQAIRQKAARRYRFLLILQLLLLALTLLNTSSRGALVALFGGTGVTGVLFLFRQGKKRGRWLNVKALGMGCCALLLAVVGFMQSSVYERFAEQGLQDNGRLLLWGTAIAVINDHPLTGTGPGTYPYIQHVYKPMALGISKMSKRAHNDYLETMATTGVIGFILLVLPVGLLLWRIFRRGDSEDNGLMLAVRASLLTFLLQSAFDTNTGIFFLPVLFITLLSLGYMLSQQAFYLPHHKKGLKD